MKQTKRAKSTSTKGHYVTNATLLPEVIRAKELGRITPELAKMLMTIAERYSRKSWFVGYSYREDMIAAALINLCNNSTGIPNALKFNPDKSSNPFSYYTTAINNSFQQFKADEKKQRKIRDTLLVEAGANPSFNFLEQERDESHETIDSDDREYRSEKDILTMSESELADLEKKLDPKLPVLDDDAPILVKKQEHPERQSGKVTFYGPGDFEIGPDGSLVLKPKAESDIVSSRDFPEPEDELE